MMVQTQTLGQSRQQTQTHGQAKQRARQTKETVAADEREVAVLEERVQAEVARDSAAKQRVKMRIAEFVREQTLRLATAPALPLRLLVVEDNGLVARTITRVLKLELGAEVHTVYDAASAIAHLALHPCDLAVIDFDLGAGVMDGLGLTQIIRDGVSTAHLPIILVSGVADTESLKSVAALARANAYFTKDEMDGLGEMVRALTTTRSAPPTPDEK